MNLDAARALARAMFAEHGLDDWTFAFNRRKRAFGLCDYTRRTIFLSSILTELNGEAEVGNTARWSSSRSTRRYGQWPPRTPCRQPLRRSAGCGAARGSSSL